MAHLLSQKPGWIGKVFSDPSVLPVIHKHFVWLNTGTSSLKSTPKIYNSASLTSSGPPMLVRHFGYWIQLAPGSNHILTTSCVMIRVEGVRGYIIFCILKIWDIILTIPRCDESFFPLIATPDHPVWYTLWVSAWSKWGREDSNVYWFSHLKFLIRLKCPGL